MQHLLAGIDASQIELSPFPHLVIEHALEPALCARLVREFPPLSSFTRGRELPPNHKMIRRAVDVAADPATTPLWQQMLAAHLTAETFQHWCRLFHEPLARYHPALALRLDGGELTRISHRGAEEKKHDTVALDAALVAHTPVPGAQRAERAPHLKAADKPFLGFLFLRDPADSGDGGELALYARRDTLPLTCGPRNTLDPARLEIVRTVPYQAGTLVLMLNTPHSITAHAPRCSAVQPMQYFHLLAELHEPLFPMPSTGQATI
jgi:hypothetical protein